MLGTLPARNAVLLHTLWFPFYWATVDCIDQRSLEKQNWLNEYIKIYIKIILKGGFIKVAYRVWSYWPNNSCLPMEDPRIQQFFSPWGRVSHLVFSTHGNADEVGSDASEGRDFLVRERENKQATRSCFSLPYTLQAVMRWDPGLGLICNLPFTLWVPFSSTLFPSFQPPNTRQKRENG